MELTIISDDADHKFSVTSELGDLLDLSYFAKTIGMTRASLLFVLASNNIPYSVKQEVLLFNSIRVARAAIAVLQENLLQKAG